MKIEFRPKLGRKGDGQRISAQLEPKRKLCEEARKTISPQVAEKRGRPEGGVEAAARELGITDDEARRSLRIASITPEAKVAAMNEGIEDNQSKLLEVAKEAPDRQVAKVIELANRPAKIAPDPLNDFETKEKWMDAIMRVWNRGSKEWRDEFMGEALRRAKGFWASCPERWSSRGRQAAMN